MPAPCKKSYDKPRQTIKKQRPHMADKGLYSPSFGISSSHVWIWELDHKEGWKLKNWCFEMWCWIRFLRVLWTAKRSNQSILKEINPEYSLEGLMLKLKLQYFGHLMWRVSSLDKTLMLGNIEGRWRRRRQRMRWLHCITDSMDMRLSKLLRWWRTGKPRALQPMGSWRLRNDWVTEMYIYIHSYEKVSEVKLAQSCLTLCHPMDCSPPSSFILRTLQARLLLCLAIPLFRGIFLTQGSNPCLLHCRQILYHLSHQGKPIHMFIYIYLLYLFGLFRKVLKVEKRKTEKLSHIW